MHSFLKSSDGWKSGNILDVRPLRDFVQGHLAGSSSHPLASGRELPSIFLPPRHEPLLVVAQKQDQARELAEKLESRGRSVVDYLAWQAGNCPSELLEKGKSRAHLWSPPPWLRENEGWLPPPAAGPVLDLGCGSGRAMVWLAEKGYRTVGIDWQPEALELGRLLAESRGVSCEFRHGDLRDMEQIPRGPWSIILNFRYLQRDLLNELPSMLKPGALALVRTFRHLTGYEGHPHRRHRLDAGELLKAFPSESCEIIAHEESFDPDGRPAAGIVARRKTT